jgi:hypothetical protein
MIAPAAVRATPRPSTVRPRSAPHEPVGRDNNGAQPRNTQRFTRSLGQIHTPLAAGPTGFGPMTSAWPISPRSARSTQRCERRLRTCAPASHPMVHVQWGVAPPAPVQGPMRHQGTGHGHRGRHHG